MQLPSLKVLASSSSLSVEARFCRYQTQEVLDIFDNHGKGSEQVVSQCFLYQNPCFQRTQQPAESLQAKALFLLGISGILVLCLKFAQFGMDLFPALHHDMFNSKKLNQICPHNVSKQVGTSSSLQYFGLQSSSSTASLSSIKSFNVLHTKSFNLHPPRISFLQSSSASLHQAQAFCTKAMILIALDISHGIKYLYEGAVLPSLESEWRRWSVVSNVLHMLPPPDVDLCKSVLRPTENEAAPVSLLSSGVNGALIIH
ncbi:hypothetical protein KIW84_051157 [Lathyrus oleraceus]|uniref:Uncharacterized protein n=1 Tax=Pisum sativum TaxID=3888 RepID=A0A9D4WNE4_PEA|nr:hypothetical protein KIW84_051157 [Pisum sativum]